MFMTVKVNSSAISEVSYDKETQILRIQFAVQTMTIRMYQSMSFII